jgi:hypothetical protein
LLFSCSKGQSSQPLPPKKKQFEFEELTPEEQEDFLNGIREHVRIENEFQESVYKQIYGLAIEDRDDGNGSDTKVRGVEGGSGSFFLDF